MVGSSSGDERKTFAPFPDGCHMPSPVSSILPKIFLSLEQPDQAGVVFPFADEKRHSGRWGGLLRAPEGGSSQAHVVSFYEDPRRILAGNF